MATQLRVNPQRSAMIGRTIRTPSDVFQTRGVPTTPAAGILSSVSPQRRGQPLIEVSPNFQPQADSQPQPGSGNWRIKAAAQKSRYQGPPANTGGEAGWAARRYYEDKVRNPFGEDDRIFTDPSFAPSPGDASAYWAAYNAGYFAPGSEWDQKTGYWSGQPRQYGGGEGGLSGRSALPPRSAFDSDAAYARAVYLASDQQRTISNAAKAGGANALLAFGLSGGNPLAAAPAGAVGFLRGATLGTLKNLGLYGYRSAMDINPAITGSYADSLTGYGSWGGYSPSQMAAVNYGGDPSVDAAENAASYALGGFYGGTNTGGSGGDSSIGGAGSDAGSGH